MATVPAAPNFVLSPALRSVLERRRIRFTRSMRELLSYYDDTVPSSLFARLAFQFSVFRAVTGPPAGLARADACICPCRYLPVYLLICVAPVAWATYARHS
ncbi:hypothetical protein FRC08_006412 [Ceratobasidium sp. 394]|nr:hypothetical protein FRC08_006412 [Ceratobasidium sp. 394]